MAISNLKNMYRAVILDHSTHPRNHHAIENPSHRMELANPTCGDVIALDAVVVDDRIVDVAFMGHGCSISMASASMMTELIKGKSLEESKQLVEEFLLMIQGIESDGVADLQDAQLLGGVAQFPARIKCATLAWKALEQVWQEKEEANE